MKKSGTFPCWRHEVDHCVTRVASVTGYWTKNGWSQERREYKRKHPLVTFPHPADFQLCVFVRHSAQNSHEPHGGSGWTRVRLAFLMHRCETLWIRRWGQPFCRTQRTLVSWVPMYRSGGTAKNTRQKSWQWVSSLSLHRKSSLFMKTCL